MPSWEIANKFEAQEWENLAFEKCDLNGEDFLAHYFEAHLCLCCFKVEQFSILRTKKKLNNGSWDFITAKWCTGCGKYHGRERINSHRAVNRPNRRRYR